MKTMHEAPQVQTIELRLENAVWQSSVIGYKPGDRITDE